MRCDPKNTPRPDWTANTPIINVIHVRVRLSFVYQAIWGEKRGPLEGLQEERRGRRHRVIMRMVIAIEVTTIIIQTSDSKVTMQG